MTKRKGPVRFELDETEPAPTPSDAPPPPEPDQPQTAAMQVATRFAARKPSWIGRIFWIAVLSLLSMQISLAAWDFVTELLTRNIWLGRVALGLLSVVLLVLLIVMLRELASIARMRRIDTLQEQVRSARAGTDRNAALRVISSLDGLYKGREELRWARETLAEQRDDLLDPDSLIDAAEQQLMQVLDAQARAEVELSARQVAATTALIPLALADVLVALIRNVSMVRRIAQIYGGRAGFLGSWRLLRIVAVHLVATGAVSIGDDMIGAMVGGGALSKISRRFGEGVINGALTARVGAVTMEVCRPMPFNSLKRPSVGSMVKSALTGLFNRSTPDG